MTHHPPTTTALPATLGDTLREARNAAGLTQAQLADFVGVTQSAVAQWEAGTALPTASRLRDLAATLNVDPAALLALVP